MKHYLLNKIKENTTLAMVICCAVPLVALSALSLFGMLGSWGYYGIMLLCPIFHLFLCRMLHKAPHAVEEIKESTHESTSNNELGYPQVYRKNNLI